MAKSEDEVLSDFKELINMTADELEAFLKTDESQGSTGAGWQKGDGSGESVGHESGRKIVEMLKKNPSKDPSQWDEDDKAHARKVVAYCKRHLAQEEKMKDSKSPEELEKTKSTISLKNWGHDPIKTLNKSSSSSSEKPTSKKAAEKPKSKQDESSSSDKPKSKKEDSKPVEKPKSSKGPASKKASDAKGNSEDAPAPAEAEKPKSKGAPAAASKTADEKDKDDGKKESEVAEAGEKRKDEEPAKSDKPASKKANKPPSEPTRKPPSRGAKKA